MKKIFHFIKNRIWVICFTTIFVLEWAVIFFLYDLPFAPLAYAIILSCVTLLFAVGFLYFQKKKKIAILKRCYVQKDHFSLHLPKPYTKEEEIYQEFIIKLHKLLIKEQEQATAEASKTENYYTLWSHQIKTPLSAIRLLLQEDPVKRGQIDLELLKVEQYVDMALQYQRLDDHTKDLQIAQYDISNMVRQVIKKIAPLFIYKKIHLDLREFSQIVITDEKWTCFLIEQILTNAVKYTPEGGTISVFLDEAIPSCLIIKDTGIGILPEDLPRVFEWGYTGYNGRIQKRSTGIGLSLCKQVADLLGHTISIESKVRIGTTVRLDLSHPPLLTE